MSDPKKKILIIDDHALFADGLALIFKSLGPSWEVTIAHNANEVLSDVAALKQKDLVLIDLHMPSMSGFNFLSAVRAQKLALNIAVISGTESNKDIERAIGLGAQGFIPKDSPSEVMLKAVSQLLSGKNYLPESYLGKVDFLAYENEIHPEQGVTERQLQVLELMQDGLQNKQIALALGISVSAVKSHIELTFKLLGVNNRTACVKAAHERGLI